MLLKTQNWKENFAENYGHNIMRTFDVLLDFPFTTSKRSLIISNKLVYTCCFTSCRTTSDIGSLEIRKILNNVTVSWKYNLVRSLPPQKNIVNTSKRLLENINWTATVIHYCTWKVEFFTNIFSMVLSWNSFFLLTHPRSLQI